MAIRKNAAPGRHFEQYVNVAAVGRLGFGYELESLTLPVDSSKRLVQDAVAIGGRLRMEFRSSSQIMVTPLAGGRMRVPGRPHPRGGHGARQMKD